MATSGPINSSPEALLDALANREDLRLIRAALGTDVKLYIVGGTVRDVLLGITAKDVDLASPLHPEEVRLRLEAQSIRVVPTGLKHQTVTAVPLPGGANIEITTFRGEQMSPQGGVSASSTIEEDVLRRDFTINALAYDMSGKAVIDVVGGRKDLERRVVRTVGAPRERFAEDPLRVLRMIRFGCAAGFSLDPKTVEAAKEFRDGLKTVSVERIRDELSKILLSARPADGFLMLSEFGFLELFIPELATCVDFEQNRFHRADVFRHTLEVVERARPELVLRLAALLHDIGKPPTLSIDPETGERHFFLHERVGAEMAEAILSRLRFSNAVTRDVVTLVQTHMRPLEAGKGGLRRILRDTGELFEIWRELKEADTLACRVTPEEFYQRLGQFDAAIAEIRKGPPLSPLSSLAIDGNDLKNAGIPFGPIIGKILRALHEQVLDNPELNERETLLMLAEKIRPALEADAG